MLRSIAAAVAALAALTVFAPGANGGFGTPTNYPAGDQPIDVAVSNFNGDLFPDIAVVDFDSGPTVGSTSTVSVLLGAPGGIFGPRTFFVVGDDPESIAVGEFNGDADPDLAVANGEPNYISDPVGVSVMLGGPGGSFAGTAFLAGADPSEVEIGQFNGDADPDLAVANEDSDNVSVLLGGSGGSFGAPANYPAGDGPSAVAVADFNGDGSPDLAVANAASDNISVLVGSSGGVFAPLGSIASGGDRPLSLAVGDFNGDADPDLAVVNFGDAKVSVLLGGPGASFGAATNLVTSNPASVTVGDVNRDGDPDLAVVNSRGDDAVSLLLGGPGGTFGAATSLAVGSDPAAVAVADTNGDSRLDLAVANFSGDDVSVLRNTIDPPVIAATSPPSPSSDNEPELRGSGAEANSTVKLYRDATCTGILLGSGTAAAFNGATGITAIVPSDQTSNLRATATDVNGNVSACSAASWPYVEDSTAPDTQIITSPPHPSNDPTGDFTFSSTGGGVSFQCRVDANPFAACTSPHATAPLSDASHTFEVRAIDAVGNIDQFPAAHTWTVDTIPVPVPVITDTDPNSPANDNTPEVKGSGAEAGSTVKLYSSRSCSAASLVGTGTAAAFNGPTGITVTVPADLTTNLWVTATDPLGSVSACLVSNPSFPYTEDSTAPATPTISDTDPDSPANHNNPGVKGSGAEANSTVHITSCGGTVYGTGTAAAFNSGAGVTAAVPGDQTTNLFAVATDQAGNNSNCSAAFPYTESSTFTETPSITDTDPDSPSPDPRPNIKGRAPAGSTVTIFASDRCSAAFEVVSGLASEFEDPGLPLRVESNTSSDFTATATIGGNTSGCSRPFTYVEDEDPPDTQILTNPPSLSNDSTGDFTFTSTGGGVSFACRVDAAPFGPFSPCTSPHATAALASGPHTFEVHAIDAAGNVDGIPASYTWTVDTIAPATPAIVATSPASPANDNNPEVRGSGAEAGSTVRLYGTPTCTGTPLATGAAATFNGATGITATVPGDATTNLRATATDPAGNPSACSALRAYTEDSSAPAAPAITDTDPDSPADDTSPEVKGTVGMGSPAQVKLYNDDSTCADPADATGTVAAFTGAGITVAVVGGHTTQLRARAVDQAGNASACSSAFAYAESTPDTSSPQTTITRKPRTNKRKKKALFMFGSSELGSSFACKLDSKPFAPCSSPTRYKRLKPKKHRFRVKATDAAGNVDATAATYRWKVKRKRKR